MSITVSTPAQICGSQLNTSKSKQLFSFPKTARFNENHKALCDNFYEIPSQKSKRKAGFGYGTKYDFTKGRFPNPAPNNYQISTQIEKQLQKKKGFIFGESRSKMYQSGPAEKHLLGIPGPGTYKNGSQLSKISYTMRPKTVNPEEYTTAVKNPGPGKYEKYETIDSKGKYFVSKYQNSCATQINPPQSKRFNEIELPGPGHYDNKILEMSDKGNYQLSGMHNSQCRSFSHNVRHGIMEGLKEKFPGVGNYRLPSDFGYYEAAKK